MRIDTLRPLVVIAAVAFLRIPLLERISHVFGSDPHLPMMTAQAHHMLPPDTTIIELSDPVGNALLSSIVAGALWGFRQL